MLTESRRCPVVRDRRLVVADRVGGEPDVARDDVIHVHDHVALNHLRVNVYLIERVDRSTRHADIAEKFEPILDRAMAEDLAHLGR